MNRILVWLTAAAMALGTASCGGGDANPPTLGAAGGTVRGPDGLSVRIGAGALDSELTIALATDSVGAPPLPAGIVAVGPVYAATPHGIAFDRPAELRVPLNPAAFAAAGSRPTLLTAAPGGEWVVLAGARRDGDAMVVDVTTFSYYTVVDCSMVGACQNLVLDATARLDLDEADPARVGPHLDRAEATFRTPRYVPLTLSFTSPGGVTNLFAYKLFITSRTGRREVAAGPMGASPLRIEIPVLEADNGYKALEVEIRCAGVERSGVCSQSGTGVTTAIQSFTARLLGSQFVVDIPAGTPVTAQLPVVTEQPGDLVVEPGAASVPFTVAVAQPNIVHAWEVSSDQGATWADLGQFPVRFATMIVPFEGERFFRVTPDPVLRSTLEYARNFDFSPPFGARRTVDASLNGLRFRARLVNAFGQRYSRVATLTVTAAVAPAIVQQPQTAAVAEGQGASFTVVASGSPAPGFQWQSRSAGASTWIDVEGQTRATYATGPLALAANGTQFRVVVSNTAGSATSEAATVSVTSSPVPPAILTAPQPLTITAGSTALFAGTVSGTGPLSYQWLRNSVAIPGANTPLLRLDAVPLEASGASFRLRVTNAIGSVDSSAALLTVVPAEGGVPLTPPSIATQPAPVTVNSGNTATFAVGVSGSGPFAFQWRRNGTPIDGATAAAYTLATAATGDAGTYSVVVTNGAGSATSSGADLVVIAPAPSVAPTITTGPTSVVVLPQATTTLAVAATGSAPLSYVWRRNGEVVDGATASLLTLAGIGAGQAGTYTVTVSNGAGAITSSAAQLLVVGAPLVTMPPGNASGVVGGTARFTVTASGDLLRFQWARNGIAIDGATSASYTTPALSLADNGAVYAVIVYNGAGLVTSAGAVLTVAPTPNPPGLVLFAGAFGETNNGTSGDGTGTAARFNEPRGLLADASGNLYVANRNGGFISKVTPGAVVTRIAEHGAAGALALGPDGSLLSMQVAINRNDYLRVLPPLQAGAATQPRNCGAPICGYTVTPTRPFAAIAADGTVYTSWQDANFISVTAGPLSEVNPPIDFFVGANDLLNRPAGWVDGSGTNARFDGPSGIVIGPDGNLYVADTNNHVIRRITPAGEVSTFAGTGTVAGSADGPLLSARFSRPLNLGFDSEGVLWVQEIGPAGAPRTSLRRIAGGQVSTPVADLQAEIDTVAGGPTSSTVVNGFNRVYGGMAVLDPKRLAFTVANALLVLTLP
jgi:Immunoglobulin I-set domain/NHL repeat